MDKIYDRQDTDTDKSFAAFCVYRDMGGDRSLEKLRIQCGYRSGRKLEQWSSKYQWVKRCAAFDDDELRSQSVALQQQRLKHKLEIEKKAWERRLKFQKKADLILNIPIVTSITTEDGLTIYTPTDKWRLTDAIAFSKYADELGIMATGGDRPNMIELDAIRVLVDAGMLPVEILAAAEIGIDNLKMGLRNAFANLNKPLYF